MVSIVHALRGPTSFPKGLVDPLDVIFFVRLLFDGVHKTYILILRTYAQYI